MNNSVMKIGAIVQARMSSSRCPAKVLRDIQGKSLLEYLLESLQCCDGLHTIVIATSKDQSDDAIENFCARNGVDCFRGSLANVASRFHGILGQHNWDAFVRVSGDSPLLDYRIVDHAVDIATASNCDLVTNVLPRTFPRGQSVEVLRASTFAMAYERMTEPGDFEHVTRHFYSHQDRYTIERIEHSPDRSQTHLAVDTPEDLARVTAIIDRLERPHWTYTVKEILQIHDEIAGPAVRRAA